VLDGPAIGFGGGDGHAQSNFIAFPRHDDGVQAAVYGGKFLNRAGNDARRAGNRELDNFFASRSVLHWPVIEPVERVKLSSMRRSVNRFSQASGSKTSVIDR